LKGGELILRTLEIYLKSGHTINVKCKDWSFQTDDVTGEFTGYNFTDLDSPSTLEIVPAQIVGYIQI